jgi:DNA polymerase elongation subunit (family B)
MKKLPKRMKGLINRKLANSHQLDWLLKNRCKHRHNYVRHFNCFIKDYGIQERIGWLDIETSNLKANFGIVLCWCILAEDGTLYEDWLTKKDVMSGIEDARVVETCIQTMREFDRVVGHYSTYFDVPFLRTRAMIHGIDYPKFGEIYHTDVWRMAKSKLCLHSNRQDVIAESLYGKTVKTRISHPHWRKAMMGNEESCMEVLHHCECDVADLKKNYESLLPYCRVTKSSI